METTILLVLLCAAAESVMIRRYDFIKTPQRWNAAQAHCRQHYTDLAFIDNVMDYEDLRKASVGHLKWVWIGLHRDPENTMAWKWSAGRNVTYTCWASGQPDNKNNIQDKVFVSANGEWLDREESTLIPFYCYSLSVVEEEAKSWEEALEHCRRRGSDLLSLRYQSSFSTRDLQEQLEKIQSRRVWIGLRFLGDRWLWLNGHVWIRPSWSTGEEEHQCPLWKRCGALTKEGLWENVDCQEKLPFICD